MAIYKDVDAFIKRQRNLYCGDCERRKNSKGKIVYEIGEAPCRACGISDMLDDLEDYPTADVQEVIYCKNCKNYCKFKNGDVVCEEFGGHIKDNDFCSRGERKNGKD